jgi:hypothetical protein
MKTYYLSILFVISSSYAAAQLNQFYHIDLPIDILTNARQMEATPDGGLIIAGNYSNLSYHRNVLLKLDSNNQISWVVNQPNYAQTMGLTPHCLVSSDGNYLFNEDVPNANPLIARESKLSKFTPNGDLIWEFQYSISQYNIPFEIIETADEIMMLVLSSENLGTTQIWHYSLVRLSFQGVFLGAILIDSQMPNNLLNAEYTAINLTNDQHILLAGEGDLWLQNGGLSRVHFVNKMSTDGALVWQYVHLPTADISEHINALIQLPCGDIIGFGSKATYAQSLNFNGTALRLSETGMLINYNDTSDSLSAFWDGVAYNECGYLAVGIDKDINLDNAALSVSPPYLFGANESDQTILEHTFSLPIVQGADGTSICKRQNGEYALLTSINMPNQVIFIQGAELSIQGDHIKNQHFDVFPNPSDGIFQVSSNSTEPMQISILDQQGKQVDQFDLDELSSDHSFDLSDQAPGVYFAHVMQGEQQWVKKLVVR